MSARKPLVYALFFLLAAPAASRAGCAKNQAVMDHGKPGMPYVCPDGTVYSAESDPDNAPPAAEDSATADEPVVQQAGPRQESDRRVREAAEQSRVPGFTGVRDHSGQTGYTFSRREEGEIRKFGQMSFADREQMMRQKFQENIVDRYGHALDQEWPGTSAGLLRAWQGAFDHLRQDAAGDGQDGHRRVFGALRGAVQGMDIVSGAGVKFIESKRQYGGDARRIPPNLMGEISGALKLGMGDRYMPGELHTTIMGAGLQNIMTTVLSAQEQRSHAGDTVARNPTAPSFNWAGKTHLATGDPRAAADYYSQALALDPKNVEALAGRASANYMMKDMAAASQDAQSALRLDPANQTANAVLKMSQGRGDSGAGTQVAAASGFGGGSGSADAAARAAAQSLYTVTPGALQANSFLQKAYNAARFGDHAASIDYATRALDADPGNLTAFLARAMAYNRTRDFNRALSDAVAGLKRDARNGALLGQKALASNNLGKYRDALEAANAALELNPRDAMAFEQRAFALAGLGDQAGALAALRRAAQESASYQPLLDQALQAPSANDLLLLFQQDRLAGGGGAPARLPLGKRFGLVAIASIAGGILLGLGLLQLFFDPIKRGLQTVFTRAGSAAPRAVLAAPPAAERDPGLLRGQYRLMRQIGAGGMGMVYEGSDVSLARRVAVKKMRDELKQDPSQRKRFLSEAKTVAALHHPNIVDIYSIIEEGGDAFLVFEFVEGRTVHDIVHSAGRLGFKESMAVLRGIAAALDYAHGKGVIHRDLKPSNVMLDEEGRAKVMDFGIARLAKDALTRLSMTNTIVGTPPYMAPEQEQGVVRRESDVYALGVCLYEMLTGKLPFLGTNGGMLMSKLNKAYQPASTLVPGLPAGLDEVLAQALEPDPDKRFKSAGDFVARLDALAAARAAQSA